MFTLNKSILDIW